MDWEFPLGYDPRRAAAAKAEMRASGQFATVAPAGSIPAAVSLTKFRGRHLEQGQAGTCWDHAPTQLVEVTMNSRALAYFPACRRLSAYEGKRYEGGGNPTNGGFGGDALKAYMQFGIGHESLAPYSDSARVLGTRPPQAVYDDAKACHLTVPVDVQGIDESKTLLGSDKPSPTSMGIWWPFGWDSRQTFMNTVGRGTFGHELLIIGYAEAGVFNEEEWIQLDNWHGLLYPPLSAELAAKVPGYQPIQADKTSDFWVARSVLDKVVGYGNAQFTSASDIDGLASGTVVTNWDGAFV